MGNSCKIYTSRDILIGPRDKLDQMAQLVFEKIVDKVKTQTGSTSPYVIGLVMIRSGLQPDKRWNGYKQFDTAWSIHSLAACRQEVGEKDLFDPGFIHFWLNREFRYQLSNGYILYHLGRTVTEISEQDCCPLTSVLPTVKSTLEKFPKLSMIPHGGRAKVLWTINGFVDYAPGINLGSTLCENWLTSENSVRAMGRADLLAYFKEIFGNDTCFIRKIQ